MTNKYKTVSFETAQKLHEAGIKLKTAFFYDTDGDLWVEDNDPNDTTEDDLAFIRLADRLIEYTTYSTTRFPAPTFDDIWNALPKDITIDSDIYHLYINKEDDYIGYYNSILRKDYIAIKIKDGLTEATAEMLLMLKHENLI